MGTATSSEKLLWGIAISTLPKLRRASQSRWRSELDCDTRLSTPPSSSTMPMRSACTWSSWLPSCSTTSTASRSGSKPAGSLSRTSLKVARSMISRAAGKWPAASTRETALAASSTVAKPTMALAR